MGRGQKRPRRWTDVSIKNILHPSRSRIKRKSDPPIRFILEADINREKADIKREKENTRARYGVLPPINRYDKPHIFTNAIGGMGIGSSINIINRRIDTLKNQQSSEILQEIIGVTNRSDIESQGPTSQMKHIRDRLMTFHGRRNTPWVYNPGVAKDHNKSIRTIDDIYNNRNINRSKCYGTGKNIHFNRDPNGSKPELQNEWEHVVPNLYQLLINGLAYTRNKSISRLLRLAMGDTFTPPIYKEFENICYLAQNRCLLLSAKAFNQAKCSYMLFNVRYVDYHGNGNRIIQLSVNEPVAEIVYDRMENGTDSQYKACHASDPKLEDVLHINDFKDNLDKVCNEYNKVMREKDGLFGVITFACGCISAAMLSYNCPTGRQIYHTSQNLPLVYNMAMEQMVILNDLEPTIRANQTILNGETILNGGKSSNDDTDFLTPKSKGRIRSETPKPPSSSSSFSSPSEIYISSDGDENDSSGEQAEAARIAAEVAEAGRVAGDMDLSETPLVSESDIRDSQEFLKGCIDLLNRLFIDKRITWGDDLYSYRFNEEITEGGSRRKKRRTKRIKNTRIKKRRKNTRRKNTRKTKRR